MKEYLDFEIRINALDAAHCVVAVHAPGGDAEGPFVSPIVDPAYQALSMRLERLDTDETLFVELGQRLFQALFPPRVQEVYARTQGMLTPDQGLRLRLVIPANDVQTAALPWEFLYDPDQGPLALLDAPVLRYLPQSAALPSLAVPLPLKVLLTAAQTPPPIAVARELGEVQAALADLGQHVEITVVPHVTRQELQRRLREGFHIWHFIGHGGYDSSGKFARLYFEDETGDADPISATELNILLHRSGLRLVVLDACEGARLATDTFRSVAPALIRAQVPAVVAMQFTIPQEATRAFASEFYRTLTEGRPLDACVTEGRKAVMNISGLRNPDWGIPVVYSRARDGKLFDIGTVARPSAGTPQPLATAQELLLAPPAPARPPEISDFVGRDAELELFVAQLATTHLVVITGLAGVGKTGLAAALARQASDPRKTFWHTFHHGEGLEALIWALAGFLATNSQPELWQMLHSTRQTGGQPPPNTVLIDYLVQMVAGRNYLLCFDDFRHVDEDPLIDQCVERLRPELRRGGLSLIVTSRRVPAFAQSADVEILTGLRLADIHRLIASRSVALDDELLTQLYAQTGGNAQLLMLSVDALRHAADPARVIGGLSKSDDIERFLLREVDVGLNESERVVMGAVAALLGYAATRDAIEAVLDDENVRRVLQGLSARHLLSVTEGKEDRAYRQHAIVQAFYYDQLGKRERQMMHRRAAAYYETEEREALRAAIHLDRAGEYARAADVATADIWRLINAGQARELCQFLERFAARQAEPESDSQRLDSDRWAAVQVALGKTYPYAGERQLARQIDQSAWEYLAGLPESQSVRSLQVQVCAEMSKLLQHEAPQQALDWLQCGMDVLAGDEKPDEVALLYLLIGNAQIASGDYSDALKAIQRGLALLSIEPGQLHMLASINLGLISFYQGDLTQAREQTLQALKISERLYDPFRKCTILGNLAMFSDVAGDWAGAAVEYRKAIDLAEHLGRIEERIRLELNLGLLEINSGDDEAALEHLANSLKLAQANQLRRYELACDSGLADLYLRLGAPERAQPLLDEAERLTNESAIRYRRSEIYRHQAQANLLANRPQAALDAVQRALTLAREPGSGNADEGLGLRVYAQVLQALGRGAEALTACERSLELLTEDPYEAARTQAQWGLALCDAGDAERGNELLSAARTTFARLGAKRDLAEVQTKLDEMSSAGASDN